MASDSEVKKNQKLTQKLRKITGLFANIDVYI